MEKEFVPYKQSLELKELGFNEECFGYFDGNCNFNFTWKGPCNFSKERFKQSLFCDGSKADDDLYGNPLGWTSSPTFSQAFRWFRENYGLESSIVFHENYLYLGKTNVYETIIEKRGENSRYFFTPIEGFITYEDAELECLKKLIEIVKSK